MATSGKKQLVLIMKNAGTACNIACVYCAEARKRNPVAQGYVTEEQAMRLAELTKGYSLSVLFHGGEPTLLGRDYYARLMEIFESQNDDVFFGLQTNATMLDDAWLDFLADNRKRLGVSVSLDGPGDVNKYRRTRDGKATYEVVAQNVRRMKERGLHTGMICTIVKSSLGHEQEMFDMVSSFGNLRFVKLNPCMDRLDDGSLPEWAVSPAQYFKFVSRFFDLMVRRASWNEYYVEPIISVLKNLQGVKSSFCCHGVNKCRSFVSIYPDGTLTSCDNYDLHHGFLAMLDDVKSIDDVLYMQRNEPLSRTYRELTASCANCSIKALCMGGCIALRERYADGDEYCKGMRGMIAHIKSVYDMLVMPQ